jgi:hypothetical protein
MIGGDQVGDGVLLNTVFRGAFGLKCQILGISCNGKYEISPSYFCIMLMRVLFQRLL